MSKKKPLKLSKEQLKRLEQSSASLPSLLEYAHQLGGFKIQALDQQDLKTKALSAMDEQTNSQMKQIYDQMSLLASQAQAIKDRVEISCQIYNANIGFETIVGQIYFLYKNKKSQKDFLSMLSPEDWGEEKMKDKEFLASVKLLADHTWEVLDKNNKN